MKDKQDQLEISSVIRQVIYDRDGNSCRVCGSFKILEIHHIVARRIGRNHDYCNLILLCSVCHDYVESGHLPHWSVNDESKLYHISPVRGFSHFYNFSLISCKTHYKILSEQVYQPPIKNYAYINNNPIF